MVPTDVKRVQKTHKNVCSHLPSHKMTQILHQTLSIGNFYELAFQRYVEVQKWTPGSKDMVCWSFKDWSLRKVQNIGDPEISVITTSEHQRYRWSHIGGREYQRTATSKHQAYQCIAYRRSSDIRDHHSQHWSTEEIGISAIEGSELLKVQTFKKFWYS